MSQNLSKYNPYTRGKGKMAAGFMLEGWDNRKIYDYIKQNQLDSKFKTPLTMEFLYKTRYRLRSEGLLEKFEQPEKDEGTGEKGNEAHTEVLGRAETSSQTDENEVVPSDAMKEKTALKGSGSPIGRPEWEVLSAAQINLIEDPALRAQILEYRTYKERQRQATQSPYVSNEQLNSFKDEVSGRMTKLEGDLIGIKDSNQQILTAINKLTGEGGESNISKPSNPKPQKQQTTIVEVAESDEVPDVSDPTMDLENENPLDAMQQDVVELEGSIISRKTVGFTPKSLMLFDMARQKGFAGNFADFVNASIDSAFKGRSFKLVVQDTV